MSYYLDANGTDGTNPSKIDRVYEDGARIASDDRKAIARREAKDKQLAARVARVTDDTGISLVAEDVRDALRALAELAGVDVGIAGVDVSK